MPATQESEREILDAAVEILSRRLPPNWVAEQATVPDSDIADLVIRTPSNQGQAYFLVEVKTDVSPRDVGTLLDGPWRKSWRRRMGNQPILLVAPYVGPRVRELLIEEGIGYLDLTGNARISSDYPGVFIELQGATHDPRSTKPRAAIRGAKAEAVVRVLVDAAPPYAGAEVARAAKVNEGYLSRILDTLADEGLIDRERSGPVTRVDWPALLRRRSQALDLFRPASTYRYVARQGASALLDRLRSRAPSGPRLPTVTGSFAAARLAPVTAPTLLVVYTPNPRNLGSELELLPAEAGADTVFIRPDNEFAFAGSKRDGGIAWAAPSQVAIDCLAGTGRMPSEGDSLIAWMQDNEGHWRYPTIQGLLANESRTGA
ncbi:MAG: hypothetical protein M0Z95_19630 [Actinomycetota bacterium]|nr:hypothetical protein [Actinomycetota bacterium]